MAGLPGATLAERRGDRPVDRPDEAPRTLPDRAASGEVALDPGLLRLHRAHVLLELVTRGTRRVERRLLARARVREPGLRPHEAALDGGHLIAPRDDGGGHPLRAVLEPGQSLGGGGRLVLGLLDRDEDHAIL